MVVQAIALLDDLDKEINIYAMRVKVCTVLKYPFLNLLTSCRRNGTVGISLKWLKSLWTISPTQKSSEQWVRSRMILSLPLLF